MFKLIFLSVIVILSAVIFNFEFMKPTRLALKDFVVNLDLNILKNKNGKQPQTTTPLQKVFSKDELAQYKGQDDGKVYLGIVGHVFDVTKGKKHYGPGGGYGFFAGIDGSQGFVTGKFDDAGLVDDISELTPSQILSLENWKLFYVKDYDHIGYVEGSFYNSKGEELPMMHVYKNKLKTAKREQELLESDRQLFPPCNSEWSQNNGGRVWCSTKSGGINRDWEGLPRMYYTAGSTRPRCACVRTTGPPSTNLDQTEHNNRGDLDNPNLQLYPNCHQNSVSCPLPNV